MLYGIYLLKSSNYQLSFHQFRICRPYYVVLPDQKTCMCIYHQKYNLAMDEYRRLSRLWHKHCTCDCTFCNEDTRAQEEGGGEEG